MALYVNNKTAMRFWCMEEFSLDNSTSSSSVRRVEGAASSLRGIDAEVLARFGSNGHKIHLLVGKASQRSRSPRIVYHVRTCPYPTGAFRRLAPGVLVASPELVFFEMANELFFYKLVEFGFLLCGTYTVNPNAIAPNGREPLTTKRKLASFIERMGTARGCSIARKALDFVFENSASPRETKTAILLCMPSRLGGYGFSEPQMNYRFDFSAEEQRLFGKSFVVLDLYWPNCRFGIEYDGGEHHTEDEDVSRDRRKSSELSYRGITVVRVDKEQIANPFQVYVLARKCARIMGRPFRKPTPAQIERRSQLFEAIMR